MNRTDEMAAVTIDYFDHNSEAYAHERYAWFAKIRSEVGPVFWSPHYGGYWVVIGWDELTSVGKDPASFSSRSHYVDPVDDVVFGGLFLPSAENPLPLLEQDPPQWNVPRRVLNALFAPPAVERMRERTQLVIDACLDQHVESGSIDLSRDLALVVSTILTLELGGVESDDFERTAETYSMNSHLAFDDPRRADLAVALEREAQRIAVAIDAQRSGALRRGAIGCLLDAQDQGVAISDEEVFGLVNLVVGAGVDTTAASLGTTFVALAQRPALVRQLVDHVELLKVAGDEFLRYATPTQGLCRTVTRDVDLGGQHLRRGDRVMLCFGAANRDPRVFEDPNEVHLDRAVSNRHVAFGSGIHRCIGSHFARMEFDLVLATVLRRIPDFTVDLSAVKSYDNVGIVAGFTRIPATFAPRDPLGVDAQIARWPPRHPSNAQR